MTHSEMLYRFVGAFVDELARSSVAHACVCPGSRSTPLALLLHRHPLIKVWTHLDERSAAFFALGIAKASGAPVAVVSTSGTAAVNFAPAVVEAYYARVPLLLVTADRPPELRDIGALQTIDQVRLYGPHVKWFVEMALPESSDDMIRYTRKVACRAVGTARAEAAGPVHINFPFREPLIPVAPVAEDPSTTSHADDFCAASTTTPAVTVTQAPRCLDASTVATLAAEFRAVERGLIICGPQDDPELPAAVVQLAAILRFPVLADPLSLVRCGPHHRPWVIDSYEAFLRDPDIVARIAPQLLLRFGAIPLSKALLLYMQRYADCRQLLIDGGDGWRDPALAATEVLHAHPRTLCQALVSALPPATEANEVSEWQAQWSALGIQARATLQEELQHLPVLCEPRVFAELASLLPTGTTLFAGNSMPVRDLDAFFPGGTQSIRFLANRGASGIDGVVSTALGASALGSNPVVLVIGDLSFYHDLNGLLAAKRHGLRALIIVLHNDGGGIFSFLPQAQQPDSDEYFEELFGTPHGLDFRPVAKMYGLTYERPADWPAFRAAVRHALTAPGVTLVEVQTERRANVAVHRRLWEVVSVAVAKTVRERNQQ